MLIMYHMNHIFIGVLVISKATQVLLVKMESPLENVMLITLGRKLERSADFVRTNHRPWAHL